MGFAVVEVTGPPDRCVFINDGQEPEGKTNDFYPVEEGCNTFELKASSMGPAAFKRVEIRAQTPPMVVDLTPK